MSKGRFNKEILNKDEDVCIEQKMIVDYIKFYLKNEDYFTMESLKLAHSYVVYDVKQLECGSKSNIDQGREYFSRILDGDPHVIVEYLKDFEKLFSYVQDTSFRNSLS